MANKVGLSHDHGFVPIGGKGGGCHLRMYQSNAMSGQPIDYAAAKAGILGMTRDLAGLLSPMGVHVNAIAPGGFGPRHLPPGFVSDYAERMAEAAGPFSISVSPCTSTPDCTASKS